MNRCMVYYVGSLPTQLVILPAQRDAHHDPVYPQPPFEIGAKPEVSLSSLYINVCYAFSCASMSNPFVLASHV